MATADTAALERISSLLARRTGFALERKLGPNVEAAVRRAMHRAGVSDLGGYLALLQGPQPYLDDLVAELVVGETYFMREPSQWKLVRETILPGLLALRGPSHVVRCWSAGCATGEEAYSLAIVAAEAELADRVEILATDISRPALARAREGKYTTWSLRTATEAFAERWFQRQGDRFVLDEQVRRRVRFAYLNLVTDAVSSAELPLADADLILCRNVLLYFDRETIARVAAKLFASLAPGGWLICGSSDPALAGYAPFEVVVTPEGIFYRRRARTDEPRAAGSSPDEAIELPSRAAAIEPDPAIVAPPRVERELVRAQPPSSPPSTGDDAAALVACLRALAASDGSVVAERAAASAAARYPLDPELHYLRGMLLLDLGRADDALASLRRVLYLDRTLAAAHYALGVVCERVGDAAGACRAYRNAARLAAARPADEPAPLSEGERNQTIAIAARARAQRLARAADGAAR